MRLSRYRRAWLRQLGRTVGRLQASTGPGARATAKSKRVLHHSDKAWLYLASLATARLPPWLDSRPDSPGVSGLLPPRASPRPRLPCLRQSRLPDRYRDFRRRKIKRLPPLAPIKRTLAALVSHE